MNSLPETPSIVLQIIIAFLTLISSLIVTYFNYRLNQSHKSKDVTKLKIIKAATHEIRQYSGKITAQGEDKDLLDYVIFTLPQKVNELEKDINNINVTLKPIISKRKGLLTINILFLLFLAT